jgi:hypothetical protein
MLDSGDARFPSASKDLIVANKAFRFVVKGEPAAILKKFLVNGSLVEAYKLPGAHRMLRPVMGAALLAEGLGRPVRFAEHGEEIIGTVLGLAS